MIKIKNMTDALNIFYNSAKVFGDATETGDYKKGNKQHDAIRKCIAYLKSEGKLEELQVFYESENPSVRLWSAYALLPVYPARSRKVLNDLIEEKCPMSFEAKITLQEWDKGTLGFPE